MKEVLLKKRHRIPAALLLVLLLVGTALAWCYFATIDSETTVQEPLSTADETEFSATMYPGKTNTWSFKIVNSADVYYSVKADLTYSAPSGVSIIKFAANGVNVTDDLLDDNSATFPIAANGDLLCSMTIRAAEDAAPGTVSVRLDLSREIGSSARHF